MPKKNQQDPYYVYLLGRLKRQNKLAGAEFDAYYSWQGEKPGLERNKKWHEFIRLRQKSHAFYDHTKELHRKYLIRKGIKPF